MAYKGYIEEGEKHGFNACLEHVVSFLLKWENQEELDIKYGYREDEKHGCMFHVQALKIGPLRIEACFGLVGYGNDNDPPEGVRELYDILKKRGIKTPKQFEDFIDCIVMMVESHGHSVNHLQSIYENKGLIKKIDIDDEENE